MSFHHIRKLAITAALVLPVSFAFAAHQGSNSANAMQAAMAKQAKSGTVDQKMLDKFVKVNKKLRAIQQDSEKKMIKALKSEGMSVQQYQQTVQKIRSNPKLNKEVQAKMQNK